MFGLTDGRTGFVRMSEQATLAQSFAYSEGSSLRGDDLYGVSSQGWGSIHAMLEKTFEWHFAALPPSQTTGTAMALPTSYLTSTKNVPAILEAMQNAQAPERVTIKFIEDLGFTSSSDRLLINVLKAVGLLTDTGHPQPAYHRFLDKSEGKFVLAEGIRSAYADLFQLNKNANTMSKPDVQAKMKTISQGQFSDDVLSKMATTFKTLCTLADFSAGPTGEQADIGDESDADQTGGGGAGGNGGGDSGTGSALKFGGLVYNINLHLPESRDPAVYDALFRSMREHLK